jgi:hypothetical protein
MANFVHYIRRGVVGSYDHGPTGDAWFAGRQPRAAGFAAPRFHVTRSVSGPAARVREGDTIWLFSRLETVWGVSPPALDACLMVGRVSKRSGLGERQGGFRYEAAAGSRWFPLSDARMCIRQLLTEDAGGRTQTLWRTRSQTFGQAIRSMRLVPDAKALDAWVRELTRRPTHFISYRLRDGTEAACAKTLQLVKDGESVFFDRWSLPRRLIERRERVSGRALNAYLLSQLRWSEVVWGIGTPQYAVEGTYSAREQETALQAGTFRLVAAGKRG